MPGEENGAVATERSYEALRDEVRAETGLTPRARRIYSLQVRHAGRDCTIEVGQPIPGGTAVVQAIIDVGGDRPYCIRMTAPDAPIRLGKRIYAANEFR